MAAEAPSDRNPIPDRVSTWLDAFFEYYHRRRPVNATFIGVHEHDHLLPDVSESGLGDGLSETRSLLRASEALGPEAIPGPEAMHGAESMDLELARGFLETQLWEYGSSHFGRGNPSFYTGEAIFGALSLFLNPATPLAQRVQAARERVEAIPEFLKRARENVTVAPASWRDRAVRECDGGIALFGVGIDLLIQEEGIADPGLRPAAERAARAFSEHRAHLTSLPASPEAGAGAAGAEALALYIERGHFVSTEADEIARYAESELEVARASLAEGASAFGANQPHEALARLADLHPSCNEYEDSYRRQWQRVQDAAEEKALLTWPDFPIEFKPRPAWCRAAAPYLYFLFYRSPAAQRRPPVHRYLVTPIDAGMPEERQEALLRETNDSVIKLNHVIHHGGLGHHVQNWHAFRSDSRVGRIAAVDCASRIALFCGGSMAEGWACYATDLAAEVGLLTPLERFAEVRGRARMCARAIVDVRLHQGRWTLRECAAFYELQASMSAAAAWNEVVKNSMFPGAAMMYLLGRDEIHHLRTDLQRSRGPAFELRAFHDQLLAYGSVPVSLVAADMRRRADAPE